MKLKNNKKSIKGLNMKKCCICGKEFEGWGNNPYPVKEEGECCNECNFMYVLPARIELLSKRDQEF